MLSAFLLTHREIVLQNKGRVRLSEHTLSSVRGLLCKAMTPLDCSLLRSTRSIALHRYFFQFHADRILHGRTASHPDRALIYTAVYQRFYNQFTKESDEDRTARAALGAMIQDQLTQLLCDVDPSQFETILTMRYMKNMQVNGQQWEMNLVGASAVAAVVNTLLASRPSSRLYLSTNEEDACMGIDFFWAEEGLGAAVSVQAVAGMEGVKAYLATRKRGKQKDSELNKKLARTREGTTLLNTILNMNWIPVLVQVGKPYKAQIDFTSTANNDWCEGLFEKITTHNARPVASSA